MANFLAPIINGQQFDANGDPLSSGTIEVYLAGTSTPATTYTTQAGGVANTFPIDLNTLGVNEDGEIWLIGGAAYKFVIKDSAGVTLRTIDNMSGVNDTTISIDQWIVYQAAPTYVSATSFTVAGDQTQTFQVNRRIKTTNTGGTVYSTIKTSTYSAPNTTVTVANDSGVLDSGLSQVSYGVISSQNSSILPLGNFSGFSSLTTNTALTVASIGYYFAISAVSLTITLPLGSAVPVGATFTFGNGIPFIIARSGSDTISARGSAGLTSVIMYGACDIVWRGDIWQVVMGGDSNLLAAPGYQKAPGGQITQWGSTIITLSAGSTGTVTFPLTFPASVYSIVVCNGDTTATTIMCGVNSFNTSGFVVQYPAAGAIATRTNWWAVGV